MDEMKSFGTHLDDERLELYSMGTLPQLEIELLEDHLLACRQCQASVTADYRQRRMIELGRSDPRGQARLTNGGRFELTSKKDHEMTDTQQTSSNTTDTIPNLPAVEHWLARYVTALLAAHRTAPNGLDFDTAANLLMAERQRFDADMETALRMFHLYPHLFQAGGAAGATASA
jgi:hypothetical protein